MKTLIVYATKYGSAAKCAEMLKQKLAEEVEVINLKDSKEINLSKFQRVIIGGSIYAGSIQKEVGTFCAQNMDVLKQKKLGLFITCMNEAAAEMQLNNVFPKELLACASAKESFGGEYNFKAMSFFEKIIVKMILKAEAKKNPDVKPVDTKQNISMLSEERISQYAVKIEEA